MGSFLIAYIVVSSLLYDIMHSLYFKLKKEIF